MPDVTPTGPLSLPFAQIAILLVACPTFRTACGVASASEALELIYYPYFDDGPEQNEWPVPGVIINDDDLNEWYIDRDLDQAGALMVTFCFEPNENYLDAPEDQILDFRNKLGAILKEVLAKANTTNPDSAEGFCFINIRKVEKASTPLLLANPKLASVPLMHAAFIFYWV